MELEEAAGEVSELTWEFETVELVSTGGSGERIWRQQEGLREILMLQRWLVRLVPVKEKQVAGELSWLRFQDLNGLSVVTIVGC